ncbi:hypothetical protein D3C80_1280680 [compost metagenome]
MISSEPMLPCQWASTRPGMMVLPAMSMTRASAGTLTEPRGPMASIRLPLMTTTPSSMTSSPFMVIRRAPLRTTRPVGLA